MYKIQWHSDMGCHYNTCCFFVRPQETTTSKSFSCQDLSTYNLSKYVKVPVWRNTVSLNKRTIEWEKDYLELQVRKLFAQHYKKKLLTNLEHRSSSSRSLLFLFQEGAYFHLNRWTISQLCARHFRETELVKHLLTLYLGLHWSQ